LSHTVAAINSLILAVLVGTTVFKYGQALTIKCALAVFSVFFFAQYRYLKYADRHNKAELQKSDITHAGGIVVRMIDNAPRYLVITAKKNTEHCLFPKGHIESGEGHGEAAIREVLEETGVEASLKEPIGTSQFQKNDQKITVEYYLMEYVANRKEPEEREQQWFSYEETLGILTFEDSKELLRLAECRLPHLDIIYT
jgi:diadenosine hexaphosphate hydrolase (ATP-forming)